jgi:hypothetical protein
MTAMPEERASPEPAHPDTPADPDPMAIAAEIKALRKGRGLRGDVARRIGPLLLELAGGGSAQVRAALAGELSRLSERLPDELEIAVLAALALHPPTEEMGTYEQRKSWVATEFDRVPRTAERRIEEAQSLLAQEVAAELLRRRARADDTDDGWYMGHFSAVFMLDGHVAEAVEQRRIVATRDHLAEITIVLDTPRESGQRRLGLTAEVTRGGTLVRTEPLSRNRTRYVIGLPRPLRLKETHEYEMKISVEPDEPLRAYYVFRPVRRCDGFDLRVRFDRRNLPAWVRRVVGEDPHVYYPYEGAPALAERVAIDTTGEAITSFTQLRPLLGYGLQWSFTEDQAGSGG